MINFRPKHSKKDRPVFLTSDSAKAEAVGLKLNRDASGASVYRFKKEVIKVGKFYKDTQDFAFEVTHDTLDHWEKTFDAWTAMGNKVSVPIGHEGYGDPEENRGWVTDLYVEGDSLIGVFELVGEDASELAAASDVSIYAPPKEIDGLGNEYIYPVTHICLTTVPVIPGLSKFEAIAASRKPLIRSYEMKLEKLADLLKLTFTKETDEEKEEKVLSKISSLLKLEDKDDEDDEEEKVEASKPSPVVMKLAKENRTIKLNKLVEEGKVTPAVVKSLSELFTTEDALALSLSKEEDDSFDKLIVALSKNNVVELTEKTKGQTIALSDPLKGVENPLIKDAENRAAKKSK